jgi:hypothetical protein
LSREFAQIDQVNKGLSRPGAGSKGPKSKKFPVFSLMIRELTTESSSHQTASSAKQSAIFAFSAQRWKIRRMFADFLDLRAAEKPRFGRQQLISAQFSPSRTEPVPFGYHRLPKKGIRQDVAFSA